MELFLFAVFGHFQLNVVEINFIDLQRQLQ